MIHTRVTGLTETRVALGRMGPSLKRDSEEADRKQAERLAVEVKAAAYSIGSTAAHVAPSVEAKAGITAMGGNAYPMTGGAEFGSNIYRQFDPFTGGTGYFFAPTMRKAEEKSETEYGNALDRTLRKVDLT